MRISGSALSRPFRLPTSSSCPLIVLHSLDTIGLAGFAHDFGALLSRPSAVGSSFDALANATIGIIDAIIFFITPVLAFLVWVPTNRQRAMTRMHAACTDLAKKIIARSKAEEKDERSIMGLLGG
jgi:hypothetical protein